MVTLLPHILISTAEFVRSSKKYLDKVEEGNPVFLKRNGIVVAVIEKAKVASVKSDNGRNQE